MRTRFRETLAVGAIAEEIGLHPVHVARTFRETRGLTIADRIRTLRIAEAERLRRASAMPLAEAAARRRCVTGLDRGNAGTNKA